MSRNAVYKYYDENMKPIYVGKTTNFNKRHESHKKDYWFTKAVYVGTAYYSSKEEMSLAEVYHITKDQPCFNKDCISGKPPKFGGKLQAIDSSKFKIVPIEDRDAIISQEKLSQLDSMLAGEFKKNYELEQKLETQKRRIKKLENVIEQKDEIILELTTDANWKMFDIDKTRRYFSLSRGVV